MPQYQQTLAVPQYTTSQLMVLAYGTFCHLGWEAELATESRLVGTTKKTWQGSHDHILIDLAEESLTVTSQLPQGASWDPFKKNKTNVGKFLAGFADVKAGATAERMERWDLALISLREQTGVALDKEKQETAEADAVMNLSSGSVTLTYGLIGINILLFVAMAATGVHLMEPLTADLIKWGANYKPLTTGGDWWRLLTSTFIHIGVIHLLFNMYALYQAGIYLEPMLGKARLLIAYLCTGLLASLCSTWWHGSESVSAGASGAIFGLYGVFLALLTTRLIPQSIRKGLLQSIGVFVFYNLAYGTASQGVDNSAHLGGLLSGFLFGYLYFFSFRSERFRPATAMGIMVVATVLLVFAYLRTASNDGTLYDQKVTEVLQIQEKAMAPLQSYTSEADLLSKLSTVSQAEWAKAKAILKETEKYKLDGNLAKHRQLLTEYIDLRIRHNDLSIVSLQGKQNVDAELEALAKKINENVAQMQKK